MKGFTLIELIVASLLISIVILIAWSGLFSALNISQVAQAKTARKFELNTALDTISNEIRQATRINRSSTMIADGSAVSVQDVAVDAGINLNDLGAYGEIALYLEIPMSDDRSKCPATPPEIIDRVVYDIRDSPLEWLSPKVLARYGRIPKANGTIDPCSSSVSSDIIADALSAADNTLPCSGVITGEKGFQTCTQDDNVQLIFQSTVKGLDATPISHSITPRNVVFALPALPELKLDVRNYTALKSTTVELEWNWVGTTVDERYQKLESYIAYPYEVSIQEEGNDIKIFKVKDYKPTMGYNLKYGFSKSPGNACFSVKGTNPDGKKIQSNQVCVVNGVIQ